jgi:Tfp pilus assembly protein PilX
MTNYNVQLRQVGAQAALPNKERNLNNAPDRENNYNSTRSNINNAPDQENNYNSTTRHMISRAQRLGRQLGR